MFELDSEDSDEIDINQTYGSPVFSPDIQTESDNYVDEIFSSSLMPESSDPIDVGLANDIFDYTSSLPSTSYLFI